MVDQDNQIIEKSDAFEMDTNWEGPVLAIGAVVGALTGLGAAYLLVIRAKKRDERPSLNAIEGMSCVTPTAAFYAMPRVALPPGKTDEDYVLGLLRARGVLCVYGSGFGLPAADGFLRIVFLAAPAELAAIYDEIAEFTREFLAR